MGLIYLLNIMYIIFLVVRQANRIFSALRYPIFPHYLLYGVICGEKKKFIGHKMGVLIFLYNLFLKHFSFKEELSDMS